MMIQFEYEKHTKNTVRFKEVAEGYKKIGTLYIQQKALENIGWEDGDMLSVNVKVM